VQRVWGPSYKPGRLRRRREACPAVLLRGAPQFDLCINRYLEI